MSLVSSGETWAPWTSWPITGRICCAFGCSPSSRAPHPYRERAALYPGKNVANTSYYGQEPGASPSILGFHSFFLRRAFPLDHTVIVCSQQLFFSFQERADVVRLLLPILFESCLQPSTSAPESDIWSLVECRYKCLQVTSYWHLCGSIEHSSLRPSPPHAGLLYRLLIDATLFFLFSHSSIPAARIRPTLANHRHLSSAARL